MKLRGVEEELAISMLISMALKRVAIPKYLQVYIACIFLIFAYTFVWQSEGSGQGGRRANLMIRILFLSFSIGLWKSVDDVHHPTPDSGYV